MLDQGPQRIRRVQDGRRSDRARPRPPTDAGEVERAVRAAASGSAWGWTKLVERFDPRVRSVARRHGLGASDADDVSQATWLCLFEHIHDVREPKAIGGWLATTAHYESLRVLRCGSREDPTDGEFVDTEHVEPINARRLIAAERRGALRARVAELPERQRVLIGMMLSEPPPDYAQIARSLGIPQGSIGPTRQRGFARLRADKTLVDMCLNEAA
jgi:RNA polymerase sigma factor (sigma-70 family)